ncbi:MAG: hypothetical protein IIY44_03155 [Erysipelotrichales bacterium]|nr:hypothetical protein [Erysipelotrichales bacterium]MBQ1387034.1 hypothetical protein [Erysipelotrichales bacterium]MBQ2310223.1 hypothetical protein [Erysipelotrichales bacterium]MBQ2478300.1 hypothetical protein [Erysipelotrichales bacterium]MBQ4375758.1 hypothetical protein [Erysipelotrichales bacterium]
MKFIKKAFILTGCVGLIIGGLMITYGVIRNQTAWEEIKRLISQDAFRTSVIGFLIVIVSVLLVMAGISIKKEPKDVPEEGPEKNNP